MNPDEMPELPPLESLVANIGSVLGAFYMARMYERTKELPIQRRLYILRAVKALEALRTSDGAREAQFLESVLDELIDVWKETGQEE